MSKLLILTLIGLSVVLACHSSCQCNEGSHNCNICELDSIGSAIDQNGRTCPCPLGYYKADYEDCNYIYADSQYSGGCAQNCRDYASLDEAKAACNLDPSCQGITWSYAGVGGSASTNPIGNGRGYQLRASGGGSYFLPNKENTWLKGKCPNNNNINDELHKQVCDFEAKQGTYLSGCAQDCKDFATLAAAQAACRADPNCGGVTFSRAEIGGSAATNALDGQYGFQLRTGRTFINSPNGENSWRKQRCNDCQYDYSDGMYSGGCVQGCKDFATLDEAKNACDADPNCKAVTYSFAAVGGFNAVDAIIGYGHGYQLRASGAGSQFKPNKENTWIKGKCPDPHSANNPCDFQAYQGTYLGGCVQNCKDFSNLADAQAACRADPSCGGVTFSRKEIGGGDASNAFDDVWGFQLRAGTTFIQSPNGENSWLKIDCPRVIHTCKKDIDNAETMDPCKIDIAKSVADIQVKTRCYLEIDNKDRSFVFSEVTLDLTQANLNQGCCGELRTLIQYQNPDTDKYENLNTDYIIDGVNGSKTLKIPLIDIYKLAYIQNVGPQQISQEVRLQIYIGHSSKFVRVHKWKLLVFTNRDEVETFQIDVDIQRTEDCSNNCVVIADLTTIGNVYTDSSFKYLQPSDHLYVVGDYFYARIIFADATYTKKLDFVSLYLKDDENRVYNFSQLTDATWDGSGLRIALRLVDPSLQSVIQVNMLIHADQQRFLQSTSQDKGQEISQQFTAQVINPKKTSSAANANDEDKKSSYSTIIFLTLNLLGLFLLF